MVETYQGAPYLKWGGYSLKHTKLTLEVALPILRLFQKESPFDAIAFCGYSGIAMGTLLCFELGVNPIAVRREVSHDTNIVFGAHNSKSYIIVDDFVDSGDTVRYIRNKVALFTAPNIITQEKVDNSQSKLSVESEMQTMDDFLNCEAAPLVSPDVIAQGSQLVGIFCYMQQSHGNYPDDEVWLDGKTFMPIRGIRP